MMADGSSLLVGVQGYRRIDTSVPPYFIESIRINRFESREILLTMHNDQLSHICSCTDGSRASFGFLAQTSPSEIRPVLFIATSSHLINQITSICATSKTKYVYLIPSSSQEASLGGARSHAPQILRVLHRLDKNQNDGTRIARLFPYLLITRCYRLKILI